MQIDNRYEVKPIEQFSTKSVKPDRTSLNQKFSMSNREFGVSGKPGINAEGFSGMREYSKMIPLATFPSRKSIH
ncbi:MAG: hypothetical protein COV67_00760 [Nitrospinae bacterium CG11_big_fil_rev_8_21_14_0_20_56_8]|nr:MAG: hypothetical protein COV67_00760 [Nitrospinae bacterium CG11_big_fil_rev_8_21_14_0_20_56_8]